MVIKGYCIAFQGNAAMHVARKSGLLSFLLSILTRLYLLSGLAVVIVALGNLLGLLSSATYTYQVVGAMIVAGVVWFLALSINAIVSAKHREQSVSVRFFRPSIGAPSSSTDSKSH